VRISEGYELDDQDFDPIAESLAAVQQQFAGERPPDGVDTLDASEDVEQTSDDLEATETDETTEQLDADAEDDEITIPAWDDPASPYYPQFLAYQQTEQKKAELEAQQERTRAILNAIRVNQDNQRVKQLLDQTAEIDPELAKQWNANRVGLIQQTQAAQQETVGYQHGMAAMHLAMVDVLGEENVAPVIARARELAAQPGLEQMQYAVQTRKQSSTQVNARIAELEKQNRVLQLQVAARQKNPAAELVDSTPVRRGKVTRPEDAENMDQFFEVFKPFG
jgi:YesN/AraC family two-component response regulator